MTCRPEVQAATETLTELTSGETEEKEVDAVVADIERKEDVSQPEEAKLRGGVFEVLAPQFQTPVPHVVGHLGDSKH